MLVKGPDGVKIADILGEQLPFFGKPAEQVAGKQGAGSAVEGAEGPGKMQVGSEDEFEFSAPEVKTPAGPLHAGERQGEAEVFEQGDRPTVGEDNGIGTVDHPVDERQAAGDVGVLVLADKIPDTGEGDDLLDLEQGMLEGQNGARIDQQRLVAVFDEVDVALKGIIRQDMADPPDPFGDLDRSVKKLGDILGCRPVVVHGVHS